jgi:hypothetical protein
MDDVRQREVKGGPRPVIRKFESLEEFKRWMNERRQGNEMEVSEA